MFFTQDDYRKILEWLSRNTIKDSEFTEAQLLNGLELVSIVLNGKNVITSIKNLVTQLSTFNTVDFLNVTTEYDAKNIHLEQAILVIPYKARKIGQVITFLDIDNKWALYQFQGLSINQWNSTSMWVNLIKEIEGVTLSADEEDLTEVSTSNGGKVIKFKDKVFADDGISGMGKVYLRKNVAGDTNILSLNMLKYTHTTYVIQYDYDLKGLTINIPDNCTLDFQGGSFRNGKIKFNNTLLLGSVNISSEIDGILKNASVEVDWFLGDNLSNTILCLVNSCSLLFFKARTYSFKDVVINKSISIVGNNTIFKPILIADSIGEPMPHNLKACNNMFKSEAEDAIIEIKGVTFKSEVTSYIYTTSTNPSSGLIYLAKLEDKYCSKPLLWFIGCKKVIVDNCNFIDIEGNSYFSKLYTYYGNKQGLALCCWDVDKVIINNNFIHNLRHDEEFWCIAVNKDREQLEVIFTNNKVDYLHPDINSSLFSTVCGTVIFSNNYVNDYKYTGSLVNLFGLNVIVEGNTIINTITDSVFDTCEYGYFYTNRLYVNNNYVEAKSGKFVVTICPNIVMTNNTFRGLVFLGASDDTINKSTSYKHFYHENHKKPINELIIIDNNNIDLTYYDNTISRWGLDWYCVGMYIRSYYNMGNMVSIRNNHIKSIENFDSLDVNNSNNYAHCPILISNIRNVEITNNYIEGGAIGALDSSVKSIVTIRPEIMREEEVGIDFGTIDSIILDNNNIITSNALYLVNIIRYRTLNNKKFKVNYLLVNGNRCNKSSFYAIYGFDVFVDNLAIYNTSFRKGTVATKYVLTNSRMLKLYELGLLLLTTVVDDKGVHNIIDPRSFSYISESELNLRKEEELAKPTANRENVRIEIGTQVLMGEGQVWVNTKVVVNYKLESEGAVKESLGADSMLWQGCIWYKLSDANNWDPYNTGNKYHKDFRDRPNNLRNVLLDEGIPIYDFFLRKPLYWNGYEWCNYNSHGADVPSFGDTSKRPSDLREKPRPEFYNGFLYFDTTLKKPIWWNGTNWVDATGTEVN